jgi:hypothetical protein
MYLNNEEQEKDMRKAIIFALAFLLLLPVAKADWWNSTWQYRRPITINNTANSNALTDYQVVVNITYNDNMQADFSDIRFIDTSNNLLSYWIESKVDSSWAYAWIKVPNIPASSYATIYAYYGNITPVSSVSNVTNSFIREIDGAQSVKGSWHLDEGSGTTAYDNSGYNNDGNLVNGPAWVDGKFGKALSFDGVNDYIDAGNSSSLNFGTGDFSVELWIKTSQTEQDIIGKLGAIGDGWVIYSLTTGEVDFSVFGSNNSPDVFGITKINDSIWHHVVGVRNGNNAILYVDGTFENSLNIGTIGSTNTTSPLIMGINEGANNIYFNGTIDEVRVYSRSLSTEEISDLYNYYGYTTTNYSGRVLVRKYTSPEPTYSIGAEEYTPTTTLPLVTGVPLLSRTLVGIAIGFGVLAFMLKTIFDINAKEIISNPEGVVMKLIALAVIVTIVVSLIVLFG